MEVITWLAAYLLVGLGVAGIVNHIGIFKDMGKEYLVVPVILLWPIPVISFIHIAIKEKFGKGGIDE